MTKVTLSIIIPIYNGEKHLNDCLNSIKNSSFSDFEVIMVNDGSKDSSESICNDFSKKDSRFKLHNKENGGVCSARNFGIKHANGKYICFADQDDIIPSDAYISLINGIKNSNADLCIGNYVIEYKNKKVNSNYKNMIYDSKEKISKNFYIPLLVHDINSKYNKLYGKPNNFIWNCIYKNSILKKNELHFFNFFEYEDDMLFNIEYIKNVSKITTIDKIVYIWTQDTNSTNKHKRYTENILEKDGKLKDYLVENVKNSEIEEKEKIQIIDDLYQSNFIRFFDYECYNNKHDFNYIENKYNIFVKSHLITKHKIYNFAYDFVYTNNYVNYLLLSSSKLKEAYFYNKKIYKPIVHKIYDIYNYFRNIL